MTREECLSMGYHWVINEDSFTNATSASCFFPSSTLHNENKIRPQEDLRNKRVRLGLKLTETSLKIIPDLKEHLKMWFTPYVNDMLEIEVLYIQ